VREWDRGVEVLRLLKLGRIEEEVGPLTGWRQAVARERIHVRGRTEDRPALAPGMCCCHRDPLARSLVRRARPSGRAARDDLKVVPYEPPFTNLEGALQHLSRRKTSACS